MVEPASIIRTEITDAIVQRDLLETAANIQVRTYFFRLAQYGFLQSAYSAIELTGENFKCAKYLYPFNENEMFLETAGSN